MSTNSKREQIISANEVLVKSLDVITTVQRVMPEYSELQNFAQPQFPVCAIVGKMPVPTEKHSTRGIGVDQIISELKVDIFTYLQVNKNVDTEISNLADDIFAKLYTDQSRNGLVIETIIEIHEKVNVWKPFAAFQITVVHKYVHDIGGL